MPKRKQRDTIRKEILLPRDLAAIVELRLYDPVHNQARYGAWSHYVERLIRQDLSSPSSMESKRETDPQAAA